MEALSRIGEFFFDDGHVSEEERLRVYQAYKEKMRAQQQQQQNQNQPIRNAKSQMSATSPSCRIAKSPTAGSKLSSPASSPKPKASQTPKAKPKAKGPTATTTPTKSVPKKIETLTKASKGTGVSSGPTRSHTTKTTNTHTTGTGTGTGTGTFTGTGTGTGASSNQLSSARETDASGETPSESSSSEDLESMIPETVCADLSMRSVSSRSVISESATGSGSSKSQRDESNNASKSGSKRPGTKTDTTGTGRASASRTGSVSVTASASASASASVSKSGSASASRSRAGSASGSRTASAHDITGTGSEGEASHDEASHDEDESESAHEQLSKNGKGHPATKRGQNRSHFGLRFLSFRLGNRSASTTTRQETITETGTLFDEQGTFERRMSHTTSNYDRSRSRGTVFSESTTATELGNSLGRKPSGKSNKSNVSSLDRKRSARSNNTDGNAGTVSFQVTPAVSQTGFEAKKKGVPSVTSSAVFSGLSSAVGTKSKKNPTSPVTLKSAKSFRTWNSKSTEGMPKAVHGWIEEEEEADGLGGRIELAVTYTPEDGDGKGNRSPTSHPTPGSPMSAKGAMDSTRVSEPEPVEANPTMETHDTQKRSIASMFRRKTLPAHLPKATAGSNVPRRSTPQSIKKADIRSDAHDTQQKQLEVGEGAPDVVNDKLAAMSSPIPKSVPSNGIVVDPLNIKKSADASQGFGHFFNSNLAPKEPDDAQGSAAERHGVSSPGAATQMRGLLMDDAMEKARIAPQVPIPQAINLSRIPATPETTNLLNLNLPERPPRFPTSLSKPDREHSNVSHPMVKRGITVTTTYSMEPSESANVQEYIEVTYDSDELESSKELITLSVTSPQNAEADEPHIEEVPRDTDGVYAGTSPKPVHSVDEKRQIPSPRTRKGFFGRRLLQRKKHEKVEKVDALSTTVNETVNETVTRHTLSSHNDQPRHVIGETSVFGEDEILSSINDSKVSLEQTKTRASRSRASSKKSSKKRSSSVPSKQGLAFNGFMQTLQLHAQGDPLENIANGNLVADPTATVPDDENTQTSGKPVVEPQAQSTLESPRRIRFPFFNRSRTKGSENPVAASPRPPGIDVADVRGGQSPRRRWVRSFSLPRTKREKRQAFDAGNEHTFNDHEEDILTPLERRRLPSTLPRNTRKKKASDSEDPLRAQGTPSAYSEGHKKAPFDANPWRSGHPNYAEMRSPRLDGTNQTVDGDRSNAALSNGNTSQKSLLSQLKRGNLTTSERALLKKALAKKLEEKKRSQIEKERLSLEKGEVDSPPDMPLPIDKPQAEPTSEQAPMQDDTEEIKKKKGLKRLKSGLMGILRRKSKKAPEEPVREMTSVHESQRNEAVDVITENQEGFLQPVQPEEDVGPGPLVPLGIGADITFLMQHQMMLQSKNPTWKQPVPRGKGSVANRFSATETLTGASASLENETQTAKLHRVLGRREEEKRVQKGESNSILDVRAPKVKKQLKVIKQVISPEPSSSVSSSQDDDDDESDSSNDGEEKGDNTLANTGSGENTTAYSVQNQRVLETLRMLHAVKKRKKRQERISRMERVTDCNAFMDPLIDGIEEAACGGHY
ncbi:expressed unknown protein [Seminavis robusta]|uniref:Uncharacterized protein n=1 Tax=Seminavis robusta TaxID=568900 RepID=A0A9N8E0Z8_9STRA|nr:expressed unknown protein [Seminavis robusta]|eukprot:Sro511_g157380.1 n/a (1573) ;mRNA; f:13009-17990